MDVDGTSQVLECGKIGYFHYLDMEIQYTKLRELLPSIIENSVNIENFRKTLIPSTDGVHSFYFLNENINCKSNSKF